MSQAGMPGGGGAAPSSGVSEAARLSSMTSATQSHDTKTGVQHIFGRFGGVLEQGLVLKHNAILDGGLLDPKKLSYLKAPVSFIKGTPLKMMGEIPGGSGSVSV